MADSTEGSSSKTTGEVGGVHPQANIASSQGGNVVTELVDAAQAAAEAVLDQQKGLIADSVSGLAEALRAGADRLQQSQGGVMPRYLEQTGSRVENFSRSMRNKSWRELVAATEEFARHQPTLFLLSAVGIGFVIGRLLSASESNSEDRWARTSDSGKSVSAVTAAVSSGSGTPAGDLTGNASRPAEPGTPSAWP
jgi:ElaB/YqjD/DUF883 family membrane-anchored ribosome-binding protein